MLCRGSPSRGYIRWLGWRSGLGPAVTAARVASGIVAAVVATAGVTASAIAVTTAFLLHLADQREGEGRAHVLEVRTHRQLDLVPPGLALDVAHRDLGL